MGRSYLFECSRCGYKAKLSGGEDAGADFSVQTILCRDCKKLYDAVVRLRVLREVQIKPAFGVPLARSRKARRASEVSPAFETVLNRFPLPGARRSRWIRYNLRCPISAIHKVQPWNDPGQCPRCGIYLEKGALPFRIWD